MARIDSVAIVGAGTMGRGIAQAAASSGHDVRLRDVDDDVLEEAQQAISKGLSKAVEAGALDKREREAALDRLTLTTDLAEAVAGADLVLEAVPEDLDLKRDVFREVEASAPAGAVLASNTSSIPIGRIAEAVDEPGRVVGAHFFNPVHAMDLVEVVRGEETAETVVDAVNAFARSLGKEPIVVRDAPGFATSRLGVALGLEAIRMVEEDVAEPQAIDKAMELGYDHPMGPLKLTDLVGLDVRLDIAEELAEELGPRFEPPDLLREMVEDGKLGRKTGEGFYTYGGDEA